MDVDEVETELQDRSPGRILTWASDEFGDDAVLTSSFQTQSLPLLHLVARYASGLPILFLETGYHFPETLEFRDRIVDNWGLNVVELRGDKGAEYAAQQGNTPLYATDPDRCCHINKVRPLDDALEDREVWISGIRRDQSGARSDAELIERTPEGILRIHPIIDWTGDDVDAYIKKHNLPHHPLTEEGYESIGCAPCTEPPSEGGDTRDGRWSGTDKTECGLHTDLRDD